MNYIYVKTYMLLYRLCDFLSKYIKIPIKLEDSKNHNTNYFRDYAEEFCAIASINCDHWFGPETVEWGKKEPLEGLVVKICSKCRCHSVNGRATRSRVG